VRLPPPTQAKVVRRNFVYLNWSFPERFEFRILKIFISFLNYERKVIKIIIQYGKLSSWALEIRVEFGDEGNFMHKWKLFRDLFGLLSSATDDETSSLLNEHANFTGQIADDDS
jgi:hypothetical protein